MARPRFDVLIRLAVLVGTGLLGWRSARRASALATSYASGIDPQGPFLIEIYDRIAGLALLDRVARRLTEGAPTDRERLFSLMRWANENVVPQYAGPDRVVADNFLSIVRRGYGYCDQTAHVFATLTRLAGYDVRLLFLRALNGTSPHTVAQVLVDDRWVLVDPWLGIVFADKIGRLLGVEDLVSHPEILRNYDRLALGDVSYFERGRPFRAFPYAGLRAVVANAQARRARSLATVRPVPHGPRPSDAAIMQMDATRWAHLEGRYGEAVAGYRDLLNAELLPEMRGAACFFLGLALVRARSAAEAIIAFDTALHADPSGPWRPSIRYFRAEAKLMSGDVAGAAEDLRAANIPSADQRLASLGQS